MMYDKKDLRVLQVLQKAREFADTDLLNEELVNTLINASFKEIDDKEKSTITKLLTSLIKAKDKALLSKK